MLRVAPGVFCLGALPLSACASVGPGTIARDRFDYDHAVTTFGGGVRARGADPEFQKIGATLRRIQASGAVGTRVEKTKEREWAVMTLQKKETTPEHREDIRIRSGRDKPDNAFVSIPNGCHWYWIENRDYRSKQIFSFLMIIFSLTDTSPAKGQPIVTIPAG